MTQIVTHSGNDIATPETFCKHHGITKQEHKHFTKMKWENRQIRVVGFDTSGPCGNWPFPKKRK